MYAFNMSMFVWISFLFIVCICVTIVNVYCKCMLWPLTIIVVRCCILTTENFRSVPTSYGSLPCSDEELHVVMTRLCLAITHLVEYCLYSSVVLPVEHVIWFSSCMGFPVSHKPVTWKHTGRLLASGLLSKVGYITRGKNFLIVRILEFYDCKRYTTALSDSVLLEDWSLFLGRLLRTCHCLGACIGHPFFYTAQVPFSLFLTL